MHLTKERHRVAIGNNTFCARFRLVCFAENVSKSDFVLGMNTTMAEKKPPIKDTKSGQRNRTGNVLWKVSYAPLSHYLFRTRAMMRLCMCVCVMRIYSHAIQIVWWKRARALRILTLDCFLNWRKNAVRVAHSNQNWKLYRSILFRECDTDGKLLCANQMWTHRFSHSFSFSCHLSGGS